MNGTSPTQIPAYSNPSLASKYPCIRVSLYTRTSEKQLLDHHVANMGVTLYREGQQAENKNNNNKQQQQQQQQQQQSSAHGDWLNSRHQYLCCHGKDETRHQHIRLNAVQTWNQFKQSSKQHCLSLIHI